MHVDFKNFSEKEIYTSIELPYKGEIPNFDTANITKLIINYVSGNIIFVPNVIELEINYRNEFDPEWIYQTLESCKIDFNKILKINISNCNDFDITKFPNAEIIFSKKQIPDIVYKFNNYELTLQDLTKIFLFKK